jgi:NTE family protein
VNALVLSAGGMYGAYQAGAWKVLSEIFQPDLVVGASIGALNGWAIAGGCTGEELSRRWLSLDAAAPVRWKMPRSLLNGVLDSTALQQIIRDIFGSYSPRVEYAAVLTDLLTLTPRVFTGRQMTWRHLVASTAILGIFDQMRIDGRIYSDGGLLKAVPLWAASALGATKALVIDIMPESPGLAAKILVGGLRRLRGFHPVISPELSTFTVTTPGLLGTPASMLTWNRENAAAWIEAGERDGARVRDSVSKWLRPDLSQGVR